MAIRLAVLRASALMLLGVPLAIGWPARVQTQTPSALSAPITHSDTLESQSPVDPAPTARLSPFGLPCGLVVTATAMPAAMVALDILDPCHPEADLEISHAGFSFAARTDMMGLLTVDIPAFETPAFVTVRRGDDDAVMAIAGLPDLADYMRAAIAWGGDLGLAFHAFAAGADFGAPGHIWQEAPGTVADMLAGKGGFLTILGDPHLTPSRQIQIFSIPQAQAKDLRLSLDIPIKPATCNRPLVAQAMQLTQSGAVDIWPITVTLPGCDTVGDFLILQNLFNAPRLDAN